MRSCSSVARRWSVRVAIALLLAAVACRHGPPVGPTGPALAPHGGLPPLARDVLERAAASLDVSVRLRALELLVEHAPVGDFPAYARRGLFDPSPYVRRRVVDALGRRLPEPLAGTLLAEAVARSDLDAFSRAHAGAALAAHGVPGAAGLLGTAWRGVRGSWDRAPLALAALRAGDDEAEAEVAAALREGAIPLEPGLLVDIGRSGRVGLLPALREARPLLEEELGLPLGIALLLLDDPAGVGVVVEALEGGEDLVALEAIDLLREVDDPRAEALLRRARSGPAGIVRTYADLVFVGRGQAPLALAIEAAGTEDTDQRCLAYEAIALVLAARPPAEALRRTDREAHDLVIQAVDGPDAAARACAARALAGVARPEDRAWLEALAMAPADEAAVEARQVEVAAALIGLTPGG